MDNELNTILTKDNDTLFIKLPIVLDKNNADDIYSTILSNIDETITTIIFNAKELRSISADGLDVILETKKKNKEIVIDNARIGICDILESYGFNNFVNISKQYRFISIKGCKIIGQGGHGTIYKLGEDTIIKVYKDHSPLEVIENERQYARNAFVNGIPTAIAYDIVETEQGYGIVFEMINGMTLGQYLRKNPDKLEEYSVKFAKLLLTLNSTVAEPDLYLDFKQVYLDRSEKAKKYIGEKDGEILKQIIKAIPDGNGMIHGDYHPNNIMIDNAGELLFIDMADISRGNSFFDLGGTYMLMNFIAKIPLLRAILKNITSLNYKECLKMWDILIRTYYNTDDEETIEKYNSQFKAFSNIRIVSSIGMKSSRKEFVTKLMAIYSKIFVIPKAQKYIDIFSNLSK